MGNPTKKKHKFDDPRDIKTILATDCGSTTTKAILIEFDEEHGEYRLAKRGEAPTTVESPFEDVTRGVLNSIKELEELTNRVFIDANEMIISPKNEKGEGADIYISTSSAGGGLQMMVSGVVKEMTAESAERAALGAGSIVMDVLATNDGRLGHERIKRIRHLRPDMMLVAGGIDGGTISHIMEIAEQIKAADPKPRFGAGYKLPIIYAGNRDAQDNIRDLLGGITDLSIVDNIRPVMEFENLTPARDKIHDLFMEHVMAQAPGYKKLMSWTYAPIMPTPGAVGSIMQRIAEIEKINLVGVDIGGATTDVFSVFDTAFNRTVSANLGMSYSISNVLAEAGLENLLRWMPFDIDEGDLRNRIKNKMIRPTTIPFALEDLVIEQAIAREALRLAFEQHKLMAVGLKGVQQERTISDAFDQSMTGETLINLMRLDLLVGSGGVMSHAPRRNQSALMLIDAFLPEGVTQLGVDSIFMMPHLGVLAEIHPEAGVEVFNKDCLISLGTCVAPIGNAKEGKTALVMSYQRPNGERVERTFNYGTIELLDMPLGETCTAVVQPTRSFDLGAGAGKEMEIELVGGVVGLIVDCRGRRPFRLPEENEKRILKLREWNKALNVFPREV